MPCTVKKTFLAAREANSHLLVQLKGNQAGLLAKARMIAARTAPLAHHVSIDANRRARHERRRIKVFDAVPELSKTRWHGLIERLIEVTRSTLSRRAKDGMWDRREETSFYLCSKAISAEDAATGDPKSLGRGEPKPLCPRCRHAGRRKPHPNKPRHLRQSPQLRPQYPPSNR